MSKRVVWGLISTLLVLVIAVIVFVILTPNSTNDESDNITRINLEEDVKQVSVLGTIKEDAVEKAVVDNATMTIGTKTIDVSDGTYATDGVAEGTQTVKISSPNHDDFEAPFEIKSGINRITFILTLTPGETLRRWFESEKSGDYSTSHKYAHPAAKAVYSKETYVKDKEDLANQGIKLVSFDIGQSRMIPEWTYPKTGKVYNDVVEVDVVQVLEQITDAQTKQLSQDVQIHLVWDGGRWKNFPMAK